VLAAELGVGELEATPELDGDGSSDEGLDGDRELVGDGSSLTLTVTVAVLDNEMDFETLTDAPMDNEGSAVCDREGDKESEAVQVADAVNDRETELATDIDAVVEGRLVTEVDEVTLAMREDETGGEADDDIRRDPEMLADGEAGD
jgi:hypothetical protein